MGNSRSESLIPTIDVFKLYIKRLQQGLNHHNFTVFINMLNLKFYEN